MKLYHGTTARHLETILRDGLKPRGRAKGNWDAAPASKDHVYLTNCYAVYYAQCATGMRAKGEVRDKLLVLEVDTTKLLPWNLYPDEDFLYHAMRSSYPGPKSHGEDMGKRVKWFRDNLAAWQGAWGDSVEVMGTCAHEGAIHAGAITRYATIALDHRLRWQSDPTVSIMNHRIMGHFYKCLTAHLFGDDTSGIEPDNDMQALQLDNVARMLKIPRDGIEVHEVKREERKTMAALRDTPRARSKVYK